MSEHKAVLVPAVCVPDWYIKNLGVKPTNDVVALKNSHAAIYRCSEALALHHHFSRPLLLDFRAEGQAR